MLPIKDMNCQVFTLIFYGIVLTGLFVVQTPVQANDVASEHLRLAENYLQENNKTAAVTHFNKAAYLFMNDNQPRQAIKYFLRVLELNLELNNERGVYLTRDNLSLLYVETEQYDYAIEQLTESILYYQRKDNKEQVTSLLTNLAEAQKEIRLYNEAENTINQAMMLAQELSNLSLLKRSYGIAYEVYEASGKNEEARTFFELKSAIDRKLKEKQIEEIKTEAEKEIQVVKTEKAKTEQELEQTQTTLQKVEKLTKEQQLELQVKQAEIDKREALLQVERLKKRFWAMAATILVLFVLVLAFLLFQLRKANKQISIQNINLERQHRDIKASIRYANTIQSAILPNLKDIQEHLKAFIIYMPKDIVSGDFYWFSVHQNGDQKTIYLAVVDCTGHGVPGAFMSMIGSQILNELVNEKRIESPAKVLEELNYSINHSLRQEETDNNDGMDLGLCRIDTTDHKNYKITYAGAKRPIYYVKAGGPLENIKGDRKSIGGYKAGRQKNSFTDKTLELMSNDMIYLFTDGFSDQNNAERKKFGRQRLEELINDCKNNDPEYQEQYILGNFTAFMDFEAQRDDITFIGLKLF